MNWRTLLLSLCILATGFPAAGAERYPDSVRSALAKDERYRDQTVLKIFVRRPAPTDSGYMYEVVLDSQGGEQLIYVDPDRGEVIYTTAPNKN